VFVTAPAVAGSMIARVPLVGGNDVTVPFEDLKFFDCHVDRVGPVENGSVAIRLSDVNGEFTEVWFKVLDDISAAALQTALFAVQSNLTCQVALTGTTADNELHRIHAINSVTIAERIGR
jgi:hypothetical protein